MRIKQLFEKHTLLCLTIGFALGIGAMTMGLLMDKVTASPAFCGTCHAMKHEAATFAESSHRNILCVDCHLPHDNIVVYYYEKGKTGMNDVYHQVLRDYPARIKLSEHGKDIVNDNCLRCHSATMDKVHVGFGKDEIGDCLKCHRRVAHGSNHLEGGIKVE